MGLKVGINGFGRIGRLVLRAALQYPDLEVVAINHKSRRLPIDKNYARKLAYSLKYDSIHGILDAEVEGEGSSLWIDGKEVKILAEKDPASLPWRDLGVDIAIESTGKFRKVKDASGHLEAGAKRVVISAPVKDDCATIVMGVNEHVYDPSNHYIISNASCTTNCLAPVAKVLHENFGIKEGLMTTVHAMTNDQLILDMPHRDERRGRAGGMSIIPTTTGAAKAVSLVLPELDGKLNGMSMRVPTTNVSIVDLVVSLENPATSENINKILENASQGSLKGILAYSDLPLVSADFNGDPHSSIVDGPSTLSIGSNMVKVVAWYDNEWGYSRRVVDLVSYIGEKGI
ncbi:MAG: type I glyceraldehyde-3-phosphate dehydrogenase [Clostridiales bacterium]|nr:type I glyceraldehyde-3-phosphate dehydrogenase [Clostridiales bacterium]MCF8021628.1 type I glyceraldehyde-3-phosphate dehydrogenase [Clostridiales bacterium]